MEGIIQLTLQALVAFAIYAAVVVAYTLLGAYKNINIWGGNWEWKKWLNGLVRYAVLGVAVLTVLISSYAIVQVAPSWGVELQNAEQVAPRVIFGILAAGILGMLLKCVGKIAEITGTSKEVVQQLQKSAIDNPDGPVVLDVADLPEGISSVDKEAKLEAALAGKTADEVKAELDSGQGAVVSVPTSSPDAFRNTVIGHGYDVDGYYNDQCWDGAALFWLNAVGRSFSTGGTGAARGGWEAARAVNAGSEFELITDRNQIRKGDWLVFGGTKWGHVGMAMSGNLGGYVRLLGQNQTGNGNGAPFSEINMNLGNFLGAFRLKRWNTSPAPSPAPAPKPTPAPAPAPNGSVKVGSVVRPLRAVDYNGTKLASFVTERNYPVTQLTGDRAVLGNGLNTAFHTGDLKVVSQPDVSPAPKPTPAPQPATFQVADQVVPTKLVDYNGTPLQQWDDAYVISELKGDRAVLTARGAVWAAVNTANLRHK